MDNAPLTILAIDDDAANVSALQALLAASFPEMTFLAAFNGREGLRLARERDPDVILLDIVMPEMDGFEVCRQLKADPSLHPVPVIFFTGVRIDKESRLKALELGAEAFLAKPLDEVELRAQIRAMRKVRQASRREQAEKERLERLVADRTLALEHELVERQRAEQTIKVEEERHRVLLDQSPDGIVILDPRTARFISFNTTAHQQLGYTREEFAQLGLHDVESVDTRDDTDRRMAEAERLGRVDYETLHHARNGDIRNVHVTAQIVVSGGHPTYYSVWRDITERKKTEEALQAANVKLQRDQLAMLNLLEDQRRVDEALRQSNALNESLLQTIPFGMDIVDQEGHLLYLSAEMERLVGKPAPNQFCWDLYRDNREQCEDCPLKSPIQVGETRVLEASGAMGGRTFSIIHTGMMYRGQKALLEVFLDITERRQADEERARLAMAIEQAAEAILITDAQANVVYVNPVFEKISGYTRQEVLGHNPRLLQSGKHDAAFYRQMWETLSRGGVWHGRMVNKRKDGTLFQEEATISPVRDANGKIVNYIAVKLDVTHEAELETQLRQAQKVEAIGQLAGGVAHDFNNLLYIILGYSEMMLGQSDIPGDLRLQIEQIHQAGTRAADLTRRLLAFSRKQIVQPKVFDIGAAITSMVKMLRRLIDEQVELNLIAPSRTCFVKADPGHIEQVVMNLCVNARDAMPHGGKLTIEVTRMTIDGSSTATPAPLPPGEYVVLVVSDTGIGMTETVKEHLFEPFFTTKAVGKGTGLGLATCYGIIKQNNGEIAVTSESGVGTTFRIYLPSAGETVAGVEHGLAVPDADRGRGERVLLVEDDRSLREMTSLILRGLGYEVLVAAGGIEALAQSDREQGKRIDLLLTDVVMPGMSGRGVARALQSSRPEMKVLYVSGYPDDTIMEHGILEPGVSLLTKPVNAATLAHKIREILDGRA